MNNLTITTNINIIDILLDLKTDIVMFYTTIHFFSNVNCIQTEHFIRKQKI